MLLARRISQIFFLLLFFALFLLAAYPLAEGVPVGFFLQLDPLLALTSMISARAFLVKMIPALILLLLTIPFGRFFCGWICPLGTAVDTSDKLIKGKFVHPSAKWKLWKFGLLIVIFTAAVISVQIGGFLDPIPLFTRTTAIFIYPMLVLGVDGMLGAAMFLPLVGDAALNLYEFLRGTLLPVTISSFTGMLPVALIFLGILLAGFIHRRFWCRNLCPLGGLLGLFSAGRRYRRIVDEACTDCGLCRKKCRMDAISEDFKGTDHKECISCMDCQALCPVNAVHFGFPKRAAVSRLDLSRRHFMTGTGAGLVTAGLFGLSYVNPRDVTAVIRPPGALQEPEFQDRCIRCGECVRVCSTAGAGLQISGMQSGISGLWTPLLKPLTGYCEYNCNLCGQVCPTGAIQNLSLEEKQEMKMGTAHFDKTRCIPWYYGEDCLVCEEHCPLSEKAIKLQKASVITIDGRQAEVLLPYVDETLCVGCGICVNRCPVEGSRGIFLTNAGEMRFSRG